MPEINTELIMRDISPFLLPKGTQTGAMAFGGLGKPVDTLKALPISSDTAILNTAQALGKTIGLDVEAVQGISEGEYWVSITTSKLAGSDDFNGWIQKLRVKDLDNAEKIKKLLVGKFEAPNYLAKQTLDEGYGRKRFIPFKNIQDAKKFLETGDASYIASRIELRGKTTTPTTALPASATQPFPVSIEVGKMIGFLPVYGTLDDAKVDYPDADYMEIRKK